jgi:hypothetical protein
MVRPDQQEKVRREENICTHIFSASATLVGVCLTVIGIFQIGKLREIGSVADNILAVDAVGFLTSCILSYAALRSKTERQQMRIEKIADVIFLTSLLLMAVVCGLVAYAFV